MTDFLGQTIEVGDAVVAVSHQKTSSTLYIGKIIDLTTKMVKIKAYRPTDDWRVNVTMTVSAYKVIKVAERFLNNIIDAGEQK